MKRSRYAASLLTALTAASMITMNSSAILKIADNPSENLLTEGIQWNFSLPDEEKQRIENISKIEFVVSIDGDVEKYEEERRSGELPGKFGGMLGIGAVVSGDAVTNPNWHEFRYNSLENVKGSATAASVEKLDEDTYLLTGDVTGITVSMPESDAVIAIKEWGNWSEDYTLKVDELYVYAADGSVAFYVDENGNADYDGHAAFDASQYGSASAAASSEETTAETTAADTTAADTTAVTTAADTTAKATAADTTAETTAAVTTKPVTNTDFGSRDSSLLIVGIVAGVVIIALIVAIIVVMGKKKK